MTWWLRVARWLPWHRKSDIDVKRDVHDAQSRLDESERIRSDAARSALRMRLHLRHNRFGDIVSREVFGGEKS